MKVGEEAVTVVVVWASTVLVKVMVGEETVTVVALPNQVPPLALDPETPARTDSATIPTNPRTTAL